jgi:serine/threonine-protein kinase
LKVRAVQQASNTVPAGQVIGTDPAANTQAAKGTTVRLIVSSGPQSTNVPSVTQQTQQAATTALTAAGFQVQTVFVPSTPANDGIVLAQDPQGNTQAPQGSTVTITVGQASPNSSTSSTT